MSKTRPSSKEEWRPVPGWEGLYDLSSLGRVRSLIFRFGRRKQPKLMRQNPNHGGYLRITMYDQLKGRKRTALVHRLICEAWHGPPPSDVHHAAHLNNHKTDNRPENLAWQLPSENIRSDGIKWIAACPHCDKPVRIMYVNHGARGHGKKRPPRLKIPNAS